MAKVNILINCYNGEKFLKETLDSVYNQTYPDWEIVFIDNCSSDGTPEIARSYDQRLKYHKTPQHMSLCEARVFAWQFIDCKYLSILDADDLLLPTKLEKQVHVLDDHDEIGLVYSNTLFFSDHESYPYYTSERPSGNIFKKLLNSYFLSLETVMVRKSVLDKHNLFFSPRYNIASDAELFIKLSYHTQAFYIDEILAKWRFGHSSESVKQFMSFPKEYETLLKDLKKMVPNFETEYVKEYKNLTAKIDYMYGVGYWKDHNHHLARQFLIKAFRKNKKYLVPLVLSYIFAFPLYRKLLKKIIKT